MQEVCNNVLQDNIRNLYDCKDIRVQLMPKDVILCIMLCGLNIVDTLLISEVVYCSV